MAHTQRQSIIQRKRTSKRTSVSSLVLFVVIALIALASNWLNKNESPSTPEPGPLVAQASGGDQASGDQASGGPVGNELAVEKKKKPTKTPTLTPSARATIRATAKATESANSRATATSMPTPRPTATSTHSAARSQSGLPLIYYDELPPEAHDTIQLLDEGGPFPFYQDDRDFQNREGLLPRKSRGYYREFTVITPGENDRGARRIIEGAEGELYYTDDHYDSFSEIVR